MSIEVISNTETKEKAQAAISGQESNQESDLENKKSASADDQLDETNEDSDTSKDTDSDDESDDQDGDSASDDKPKKKNGFQKRINKLSKSRAEEQRLKLLAEQERDYWREQALKSKNTDQEHQAKKTDDVNQASDKPKPPRMADFDSHEEYEAARDDYQEKLSDWKYEQKEKDKEAKSKQEQVKSSYQKSIETHAERVKEFKKTQSDFDEVVGDFIEDLKSEKKLVSIAVEESIYGSEIGPAIVYELAKNPEEFDRINSLGALAAAREIGKIEARLSKESSNTNEKKQTKAPPPPNPVGSKGSGSTKKSIYDPNLPFEEYEAMRREQMKTKGRSSFF